MRSSAGRRAAAWCVLAAATVAAYAGVWDFDFVSYDDDVFVYTNPHLVEGLGPSGLAWALTEFYAANWIPLTWISLLLDFEMYGLDPAGFHLTNLMLHVASAIALFAALERMTGALGRSFFVAAVFALHPLHVESVAWVAERKDTLCGFFFTGTLLAYALYSERADGGLKASSAERASSAESGDAAGRQSGRAVPFAAFTLLGLASMLSKPMAVTLPFVLLLLDAWPLGRFAGGVGRMRALVLEKAPLFAAAAIVSALTWLAQSGAGAAVSAERLTVWTRVANSLVSYLRYIELTLWPADLAVLYPYPPGGPSTAAWALSGVVLLAITAVVVAARRAPLTVGWLWYLGTLVPVIGLVQVGSQPMADRYAYLPQTGLAVMLAFGWPGPLHATAARRTVTAQAALGAAALLALGLATHAQLQYWRSSEALFERALAVTSNNFIMQAHLGAERLRKGDKRGAAELWRESVRSNPAQVDVQNNLAWLLATDPESDAGAIMEAVRHAEQVRLRTGEEPAAAVLDTLAVAYARAGRFQEASMVAQAAIHAALTNGDARLVGELEGRAALFRQGRAYVIGDDAGR